MMIFFWALMGIGIYYLLTNKKDVNLGNNHKTSPEEKLKERYVNGEIDEETFNKMLKTIKE